MGEGLQDHPAVLVSYESTQSVSLTNHIRLLGTSLPNPLTLLNWFVRGKGALTTVACEQGGFFHTSPDREQPDLQVFCERWRVICSLPSPAPSPLP